MKGSEQSWCVIGWVHSMLFGWYDVLCILTMCFLAVLPLQAILNEIPTKINQIWKSEVGQIGYFWNTCTYDWLHRSLFFFPIIFFLFYISTPYLHVLSMWPPPPGLEQSRVLAVVCIKQPVFPQPRSWITDGHSTSQATTFAYQARRLPLTCRVSSL